MAAKKPAAAAAAKPEDTQPAPSAPVVASDTEQPTEKTAPAVTAPQGAQETPSPEAAKEGDAVEGLWIRSVPTSIRRAGYRFTREGVGFAADAFQELFSAEQYQQLISDPDLVIEECSFIDGEPQR